MSKEEELLAKLYQCQDMMAELLDRGDQDFHYLLMEMLVKRLESHLENNKDLM